MKKQAAMLVAAGGLLAATLALGQMGPGSGMGGGMMGGPGMRGIGPEGVSVVRHRYVMTNGIEPKYAKARNPLKATAANRAAGKAVFQQTCSACHGPAGLGDGPAAKGLNPPPANLTAVMGMPIASDAYLDWTVSEGGVPVHSAMPAFKGVLKPDRIWQVILYLRTLQPAS
jgi:mono/diheme cytochrome c family protein